MVLPAAANPRHHAPLDRRLVMPLSPCPPFSPVTGRPADRYGVGESTQRKHLALIRGESPDAFKAKARASTIRAAVEAHPRPSSGQR